MRFTPIAALLLASFVLQSQAAEQRRYTILVDNGIKAGEQIVDIDDNGELKVRFIFKDNGRGPELNESIKLNPDGTIASYSSQGKSTFGSVINEKFQRDGDKASWSAGQKQGQSQVKGAAMFLPVDGSPELSSIAINAIAKSGSNSIALLPSGTDRKSVV